jgi:hypothetical protein
LTFARIHSTRELNIERSTRLSKRIDEIVVAYVENNDLQPLFEAYKGAATLEALEKGWASRKQGHEAEFGPLVGYTLLGTALRDERDVTLVRHRFENGFGDTAFVWDPEQEEHLLGRSVRGLNPDVRFVPTGGTTFGSWDGGFSDSRPLSFEDDGTSLSIEGSAGTIVARREH